MRLTVLAVALGIATAGGSLARTAVLLLLVDHSAVFVSVFLFAGFVPSVVLAPMPAPAVDRVESRRLLIGTLLAQAVVSYRGVHPCPAAYQVRSKRFREASACAMRRSAASRLSPSTVPTTAPSTMFSAERSCASASISAAATRSADSA